MVAENIDVLGLLILEFNTTFKFFFYIFDLSSNI